MGGLETMKEVEEGSRQRIAPGWSVASDYWQQVPMCQNQRCTCCSTLRMEVRDRRPGNRDWLEARDDSIYPPTQRMRRSPKAFGDEGLVPISFSF